MANLKDQVQIGSMRLRNRMVLPPLTTNCAGANGTVSEGILRFYKERSRHAGMVVVEATAVRPDGRIVACSLGLWDDAQVPGMTKLSERIRKQGAASVVQLNHAGARCTPLGGELQGASPSGVAFRPDVEPFPMNQAQIEKMVASYADAAVRAKEAGFEGVEIHGAHFYLISQFLSPLTNRREDRYGGDARGRATFAIEVLAAVRERVGRTYPVLFRVNAVENVEGGQSVEDAQTVGRLLAEHGANALDVSLVTRAPWREEKGRRLLTPASAFLKDDPAGANVNLTADMRRAAGIPVIAVGKLGEPGVAAEAVAASGVDMVAIGRQMIADPDAAEKILEGKEDEIVRCKECLKCFASLARKGPVTCAVNKEMGA